MASISLRTWLLNLDTHVAECRRLADEALASAQSAAEAASGVTALRDQAVAAKGSALAAKAEILTAKDAASASAAAAASASAAARAAAERAEAMGALVSAARSYARAPIHFIQLRRAGGGTGFAMPADARPVGDWEVHMLVWPGDSPLWTSAFLGGPAAVGPLDNWRIGAGIGSSDLSLVTTTSDVVVATRRLAAIRKEDWQWVSIRRTGDLVTAAVDGVDGAAPLDLNGALNDKSVFTPAHLFCGYGGAHGDWEGSIATVLLTEPLTASEREALVAGIAPPPAKTLSRWAPETLALRGSVGARRWCDALGVRDLAGVDGSMLTSYGYGAGGPASARSYAVTIAATTIPAASGSVPGEVMALVPVPGARLVPGDLVVLQRDPGSALAVGVTIDTTEINVAGPEALYVRLINLRTVVVTTAICPATALHMIV